jgi:hypothetical protein
LGFQEHRAIRQNSSGARDVPRKQQRAMEEHGRQKLSKKFEQKVAKVTKGDRDWVSGASGDSTKLLRRA